MAVTRGVAISAYSAPFSKGAKVYKENIASGTITSAQVAASTLPVSKLKYAYVTGTLTTDAAVVAKAHGLGAVPTVAIVFPRGTGAKINGAASALVGLASVSASTSANIYVTGQAGAGYAAFVLL